MELSMCLDKYFECPSELVPSGVAIILSSLSGFWQYYKKENSWQGHSLAATARGGRDDLGKASNDSVKPLSEASLAQPHSKAVFLCPL